MSRLIELSVAEKEGEGKRGWNRMLALHLASLFRLHIQLPRMDPSCYVSQSLSLPVEGCCLQKGSWATLPGSALGTTVLQSHILLNVPMPVQHFKTTLRLRSIIKLISLSSASAKMKQEESIQERATGELQPRYPCTGDRSS